MTRIRRQPFMTQLGAGGILTGTLLLSSAFSSAGGAIHESACFVGPMQVRQTLQTSAVVAADIDGDGKLDVANASIMRVEWQRNAAGDGTSWSSTDVVFPVYGFAGIGTADVDGDGDLDVVSASPDQGLVSWQENLQGDGAAWTTHAVATVPGARKVALADVDGDGDLDVAVVPGASGEIEWYENATGDGASWIQRPVSALARDTRSVAAADMDGDGDVDLLSASFAEGEVVWHENLDGHGGSWARHTIATGVHGAVAVLALDADGDGDQDVFSASGDDGIVTLFENTTGQGSAWSARLVSGLATGVRALASSDLDGDGDQDLAAVLYDALSWYENADGAGHSWVSHAVTTDTPRPSALDVGDVDGDGRKDFVVGDEWSDILWRPNRGGQFSVAAADIATELVAGGHLAPLLRLDVTHLGRQGDPDLELASLGLLFEGTPSEPLTNLQANALIETLRVYRDADGDGIFDPGADVLVTSLGALALTDGVQIVPFGDGDPGLQVHFGSPRTYFVVAELTLDAGAQPLHQFFATHLGLGPSATRAENREDDTPLQPACPTDVRSGLIIALLAPGGYLQASQTISGHLQEGGEVTFTFVVDNIGTGTQADNPGDEFIDDMTDLVVVTGADSDSGTTTVSGNSVRWNGAIPSLGQATIRVHAIIKGGTAFYVVESYAQLWYDPDADGVNDQVFITDDLAFMVNLPVKGDLAHGSAREGDLEPPPGFYPDRDFYRLFQAPQSSYEVVLDSASGDIGGSQGPALDLVSPSLVVLATSSPAGTGGSRSLRFENAGSAPATDALVRVQSNGCGLDCTQDDRYQLRAYDTTLHAPRLALGVQVAAVILQNAAAQEVHGHVWLRDVAGADAGGLPFTLPPHGSLAMTTSTLASSGSVAVSHDGAFGALGGKIVAVQPTGLTFDTPLSPRPR